MASFVHDGQRIAYTEYGGGPAAVTPNGRRGRTARSAPAAGRPVILVHGLLLSQEMHRPLARDLAALGNRVITVDLLGHGESDRPRDMWRYSMRFFGEQVVALMDHLELEQAVVMGTSLGANTALEIAAAAPERLRRGSTSGASPPTATSAAHSRHPRSSSATAAIPSIPSPTPACSPKSCRTATSSKPTRSSSCGCAPRASPPRSPPSSTKSGAAAAANPPLGSRRVQLDLVEVHVPRRLRRADR
jgi:pimeloyl-ACP methyl ester carboxylesterase